MLGYAKDDRFGKNIFQEFRTYRKQTQRNYSTS
ncbi:MAG UNVERIFIED_CONTAM: hypothetical protein LVR29_09740 [Microcystis novacekii LVE1205-3]